MADVIAITRIEYGTGNGQVEVYAIGDNLSDLTDDEKRSLVIGGSAVEIGKGRKFTLEPSVTNPDEATVDRDALIAKALSNSEPEAPTKPVVATPATPKAPTS